MEKNMKKLFGLLVVGLILYSGVLSSTDKQPRAASPAAVPATPSCKSDWTKCTDNSDMANNYGGWFDVKYDCKKQANDLAKYGTPEWPWLAFSSFYPGTNYSTGIVTVIEPDAKFQNGFSAMVRSRVVCEYDLRAKRVINVSIGAR
jgi:hypothetical protein